MSDSNRSGARVSAPKMFSETYPELFADLPAEFDWQMRPVLVVAISGDASQNGGEYVGMPRIGSSLAKAIAISGRRPDEANYVEIYRYPGTYSFPRNLAWKSLPLIEHANFRYDFHRQEPLDQNAGLERRAGSISFSAFKNDKMPAAQAKVVEGVDALVISSFDLSDHDLRVSTAPFDNVPVEAFPTVIHHGRHGASQVIPLSEVQRVKARFRAEERFIFNHVVNFTILAGRALYNLAYEDRLPQSLVNSAMPGLKMFRWESSHPLVLQALHLLRKTGDPVPADAFTLADVDYKQFPFAMANGVPFMRPEGDGYVFEWRGTGKYEPWSIPLGHLDDYDRAPPKLSITRSTHPLFDLFRWLASMRLIGRRGDRFAITDVGCRFLDLIGPDSEDIDLPLRWRTASGEWGSEDDIPAMDRWLNRAFRSVKRRVGVLPAAPFSERPYAVPEDNFLENQVVIRGVLVPIEDDDMHDPVVAAEIARMGKFETVVTDSRTGVIFDPPRLGCEPKVRAVWAGVPLGVFDRADIYQQRVDLFRDMTSIDIEAKAAISTLPTALQKAPFIDRIGTRPLLETREPCGRFIELPQQMEFDEGDTIADIIHGQVLSIRDLSNAPDEFKMRAAMHRHYSLLGDPQQTDGLRVYGDCETSATFSYGILVGRVNLTTGKGTTSRKVGDVADYVKRAKRDHAELHFFFDHPETSTNGHWVIDPDGNVCNPSPTPPSEGVRNPLYRATALAKPEKSESAATTSITTDRAPADGDTQMTEIADATIQSELAAHLSAKNGFALADERPAVDPVKTITTSKPTQDEQRLLIFSDIYEKEWIESIDPDGIIEGVKRNPMSVMSITGVPETHLPMVPGIDARGEHTTPFGLARVSRNRKKPQTENEYAQQLRSLVSCGASVIFAAGTDGGPPGIYEANGPVLRMPETNAFELAARVLLRCEREIAEKGLDSISVSGADGDNVSVAEVMRKDGTVLFRGNWERVFIPYRYLSAMWARIKKAVTYGNLDIAELVAMGHWEKRAKIAGVSNDDGPATLADIPGIGRVRKRLEALYRKMDGNGGKVGIIFHGKPGTGKTMIARTLARDTGRHFVLGSFAEWQSSGEGNLGSTLSAMRASFEEAKANQPALLFLDEMDSLGARGENGKNDSYMRAVINSFLEMVQGFRGRGDVVVVGATNFLKDLDPAITRSGRLGDHVLIDIPDRNEVKEIVDWFARKKGHGAKVNAERYADLLVGCTPADIHSIFDEALLASDSEGEAFEQRHLDEAICVIGGEQTLGKGLSRFFTQHEAARLVSLYLTGGLDDVACARSHPGISDPTGIVLKGRPASSMSSDLVRRLKFQLSGLAFASLANETQADVGSVARPCIEAARKIANELVALGIGAGNKVSFTPLSDSPSVDRAMTEWLTWAHEQATAELAPHVEVIDKLSSELDACKHMDASEIKAFIETQMHAPATMRAA